MKTKVSNLTSAIITTLFLLYSSVSICLADAGNMIDLTVPNVNYLEATGIDSAVGSEITVELWFKGSGLATDVPLFKLSNMADPIYFLFRIYNYGNTAYYGELSSQAVNTSTVAVPLSLTNSSWHHVALVWETSILRIYFDGNLAAEHSYKALEVPSNLKLSLGPEGQVEEFRIWDHARTLEQIQQYKDRSLTGSESGLILYYDFNETSGDYAYDKSSYSYNGYVYHGTSTDFWKPSTLILDLSEVETVLVSDVTAYSAILNGNVTYDGGDPITARGFCWGSSPNPDLSNNVITDPVPDTGTYSSELTFLAPQMLYYIRAYVTNVNGTTYGEQLTFTTTAEPVPDPPGYALMLDGDDYVDMGNSTGLNFSGTTPFTFEAWVRPEMDNLSGTIFSKYDKAVAEQYYLALDNGRAVVHRADGSTALTGTSDLAGGSWYHIAAVYDSSTLHLYVNGVLEVSNVSGAVPDVSSNVLIGARKENGALSGWFIGALDEIRIWDTARSLSEIQSGMTAYLTGSEANLVAWYAFDYPIQGTSQTVPDETGNGNNGITRDDPTVVVSAALGVPHVTTVKVDVVSREFATLSGQIIQNGSSALVDWGICYNTSGKPFYNDFRTVGEALDTETGFFNTVLKGLTPGVIYFARVYAVNSNGIGYGEEIRFTTAMLPPGNALDFDSDQDGVYTGGLDLDEQTAYTVEFWLKASKVGACLTNHASTTLIAFGMESSSYPRGHHIFADQKHVHLSMDDPRRGLDTADNQWHHIAVTFRENDPAGFTSYFDGQLIASQSTEGIGGPVWNNDPFLLFGNSLYYSDAYLNGQMDEVRIWTRAKTADEIRRDQFRTFYGNEDNLLLYYRCDHSRGAILEDASGNSYDGLLGGLSPLGTLGTPGWTLSEVPLGVPFVETELFNLRPVYTAQIQGTMQDNNGEAVTAQGICWNTSGFPSINDKRIPAGTDVGNQYTLEISNLTPGTTYYVRAYAQNAVGVGYGNQVAFSAQIPGSGNTLTFDGIDDSVEIADPFADPAAFTIAMWVKPSVINTTPTQGFIGDSGSNYRKPGMGIWSADGGLHYDSYDDAGQQYSAILNDFFTAPDEWVHVAWVKDGSNYLFYRNGVLFATEPAPAIIWTDRLSPYYIGTPDAPFSGEIDEVRIYSRALSGQEVADSYSSQLFGDESGLTAYYNFNQTVGNLLVDSSGSDNHGLLENDPQWTTPDSLNIGSMEVWVDDDYTEFGTNDGRTFGLDAFNTLKPALAAVLDDGIINVKDGEYKGNDNRGLSIKDRSLTIRSENGPGQTIINPEHESFSFSLNNSDTTIEGLTIFGGGMLIYDSSPSISNCNFIQNIGFKGGAIMVFGSTETANLMISGCTFLENKAEAGGAVFVADNTSVSIQNSVFVSNESSVGGGGALAIEPIGGTTMPAVVTITNSTFLNNEAATAGDALWCAADSTNSQSATTTVTNTILWGADTPIGQEDSGTVTVTYSTVQGGHTGSGNISDYPGFVYSTDPHIQAGSPCIDAGTNSPPAGLPATDLYGNERIVNGVTDIGAHESQAGMPLIGLSKTMFHFTALENETDPDDQSMLIKNGADGILDYQISTSCPWLIPVPDSGSLTTYSDIINLHVDAGQLPFGMHTCFLEITSPEATNSPRTIPVSVNIRKQLVVDPSDPASFATIQAAIDAAENGETILVKDGIYSGVGNVNLNFHDGFGSFKAITVRSENGPQYSIIDCENTSNTRGITFSHDETADAVFEGFTIRNGNQYAGGGIYIMGAAAPTIRNCIIENCAADTNGGGIFVGDTASPTLIGCRVEGNTALGYGSGIYTDDNAAPIITNTLIVKNSTLTGYGGGLYVGHNSLPELTNVTIAENSAVEGGGVYCSSSARTILTNSILWGNGNEQIAGLGIITATYCDIEGGYAGVENINLDPLFVDPNNGNYYLGLDSPCINVGNNSASALPEEDIDGSNRILDGKVDLGPYESGSTETANYLITDIPDQTFSPGYNLNFSLFSDHWGSGDFLDIVYSYDITWGTPVGNITLDPVTGEFQYLAPEVQPGDSQNDWRPFAITFIGTANGEAISQTVSFNSGYQLPVEHSLVEPSLPVPNPDDDAYIVRNEQWYEATPGLNFNYLPNPAPGPPEVPLELGTIDIAGKTLVIEAGHANGIYDDYHNRKTLQSITLYAETVVIRDPWHLPQTDVSIYARTLRFEDDGQISTLPEALADAAIDAEYILDEQTHGIIYDGDVPTYTPPGVAQDGLPAGTLTLNVKELDAGYAGGGQQPIRFRLEGGQGQGAGSGLHGPPGMSCQRYDVTNLTLSACQTTDLFGCSPPNIVTCGNDNLSNFDDGTIYITWCDNVFRIQRYIGEENTDCWPKDGSDAVPGSQPGFGGLGGDLTTNVNTDTGGWPLNGFIYNDGGVKGAQDTMRNGGYPGQPNPAYKYYFYEVDDWPGLRVGGPTEYGQDAAPPTSLNGQPGQLIFAGHSLSWLHPYGLKSTLAYARNVFLNEHSEEARNLIVDYPDLIEAYIQANPSSVFELDLMQMRDEILTILYKIDMDLDYFGNPKGWAPMLSFEVTRTAYQNEIEHALEVLYLNHWIRKAQNRALVVVDALAESKILLEEEIAQFRQNFIDAQLKLDELQSESWSIDDQISLLRAELSAKKKDIKLIHMGFSAAEFGLGQTSALLSMVPKAGKTLKGGLSLAMNIGQNVPLPLDLVGVIYEDISTNILSSDYPTKADEVNSVLSPPMNLKDILEKSKVIAKGLGTIAGMMKDSEANPKDIISTLNKLRGTYPFLSTVITDVIKLMDQKLDYATLVEETMEKIAALPNMIANNQLAVTQVKRYLTETGNVILEEGDLVYLAEMERRASERLTRYHYYMAKAYTYRMLTPYPYPHDLTNLLDEIITLVDANLSHAGDQGWVPQFKLEVTSTDFDNLKTLFEEELWSIADQTLTEYLSTRGGGELSTSVSIGLTEDEVGTLNQEGTVTVNLVERGFFATDKQDIRLVNLEVDHVAPVDPNIDFGTFASVEILMKHSGRSLLTLDGETYFFQHHNKFDNNGQTAQITWGATYDYYASIPGDEIINPITPSEASDSLLLTMLDAHSKGDHIMIYSRPAAWADITITAQSTTDSGELVELSELDLRITYDWSTQTTANRLNVSTEGADILPHFQLDATDLSGRKDGRGQFVRFFDTSLAEVAIEAQKRFGPFTFDHWTNRQGNPPTGVTGGLQNNSITVSLSTDQDIKAWYILDADSDNMEDNWENEHFGDLNVSDGTGDSDGDGLTDLEESRLGSNPNKVDTDDDGMPDGWEVDNQLNILENDAMANPDEDAAPNIAEYQAGTDPNDENDIPPLDSVLEDFESGDLSRFAWNNQGDGVWEVSPKNALSGAFSARSPVLADGQSARLETQVICEAGSVVFTYRNSSEYCGNVLCDGLVFSIDGTVMDYFTGETGTQTVLYDVTAGSHTFTWEYMKDVSDSSGDDQVYIDNIWFPAILSALDTDNDGMPDSFEIDHNLNPFLDDSLADNDGDGFSNEREFAAGTNPSDPDDYPQVPGDVNRDSEVDLRDACLSLQVLVGIAPAGIHITGADVNGDGSIGLEEIFYILRTVSESN